MSEQPPRRKSDHRAVSRVVAAPTSLHETLNAANPSLERESALYATCQHLIGSQLVKLWSNWSNSGQLVKLWSNSGQFCKNA